MDNEIDEVVREYAEIYRLLARRASPLEVTRDWLKRDAVALARITVASPVEQLKKQAKSDGKPTPASHVNMLADACKTVPFDLMVRSR